MMDQQSMDITIPNLKPEASFKLNPEFVGYFRVHYGPEDLDRLCTSIQNKVGFTSVQGELEQCVFF